jgi:uncharacterized heparinase superfamily protein
MAADGSVTFLNQKVSSFSSALWHSEDYNLLWLYHLHYLDDLDAVDVDHERADRLRLLEDWIASNPPVQGTGWEPYPLSIRIVNIVKFLASHPAKAHPKLLSSVAAQATALERRIERHLRANHLFENGKALLFAGCFLQGGRADSWKAIGLEILDAECREQFLADGGHFELSPMYHATMLWSLCDLIALANATALQDLLIRAPSWKKLVERGVQWYQSMVHPDGQIAFFNDAALGHAPDLAITQRYAQMLEIPVRQPEPGTEWPSLTDLYASGYIRVEHAHGAAAILDVARVGPAYQPGHAHADTLSFELSLFNQRVFVNSGTSTYGRSIERDLQRGTAAHNTVIIDGRNSSDTWAGFRVGRRAVPATPVFKRESDEISVDANHNGYRRLFGGATHRRQWTFTKTSLTVLDRIDGRFHDAYAHYHLHPRVQVRPDHRDPARIELRLPEGQSATVDIPQGRLTVIPSLWHPEFGRSVPTQCLRVQFVTPEAEARIVWQLPR